MKVFIYMTSMSNATLSNHLINVNRILCQIEGHEKHNNNFSCQKVCIEISQRKYQNWTSQFENNIKEYEGTTFPALGTSNSILVWATSVCGFVMVLSIKDFGKISQASHDEFAHF